MLQYITVVKASNSSYSGSSHFLPAEMEIYLKLSYVVFRYFLSSCAANRTPNGGLSLRSLCTIV